MYQQPAAYPPTDSAEVEAVNVFEGLIDSNIVKSYLHTRDKIPNYDGYIELVDSEGISLGFIFVQIKKLDDNELSPPKYAKCEMSFLNFCKKTNPPMIFVGVDTKNKIAYWEEINVDFIAKYGKDDQKTITLNFQQENKVDGKQKEYMAKWKAIIENQKNKLSLFDSIKEQKEILEKTYLFSSLA